MFINQLRLSELMVQRYGHYLARTTMKFSYLCVILTGRLIVYGRSVNFVYEWGNSA